MFEEGHSFLCIQGGLMRGTLFWVYREGLMRGTLSWVYRDGLRRGTLSCYDLISLLAFGIMHKVLQCVSFGL